MEESRAASKVGWKARFIGILHTREHGCGRVGGAFQESTISKQEGNGQIDRIEDEKVAVVPSNDLPFPRDLEIRRRVRRSKRPRQVQRPIVIQNQSPDRKSTRLNSSHRNTSRMPSSA